MSQVGFSKILEQWEYIITIRSPFGHSYEPYPMTMDELNVFGKDGWELVTIRDEMSGAAVSTWFGERYIFKRRK